jgi:hypothetical protein
VSRVLLGIAILLLLGLAYAGIDGGFDQLSQTDKTLGQQVQTVTQLAFGVLSIAVIAVWFWARQWSRPVLVAWAVSLGLAGGLAPVVWGEATIPIGILSGVASLLIAGGIVWLLRFGARGAA